MDDTRQTCLEGDVVVAILIVDDNPVNAKLLVLTLRGADFQSKVAGNGWVGVGGEGPCLTPIQSHAHSYRIGPYADLETVKRAQHVRCDGFLVKPIDRQQLINRVGELLQSKPQVLLDKWITIGKLDVSPVEYDDLVKVFAGQVSTALKAVAMEQSDSREPISEDLRKLLIEFDDSASMLGANQFAQVYSAYKENGEGSLPTAPPSTAAIGESAHGSNVI